MDDSTRQIIDEDQSTVQEVQTQETPTHDVHDVIESDEHDLSDASPYVDSESDNECRRPTPNGRKFKAIHGTNCYKLYNFVENHNHPLVDENNLDNLKARRKLDFSDKVFIHRASLSNIGPTKAHRLRVAFMGGYHKVRGKAIDWKKYIGPRDAQMLVDKLNDRKKHVPNFSFECKTVNDELSRMFWADETTKCNYIAFGDVVSFDET
ncbi:FAR1-related sequence 5-like protein [Tanacetum coccineum]